MSKKNELSFKVKMIVDDIVKEKSYGTLEQAKNDYEQIRKVRRDIPVQLLSTTGRIDLIMIESNWNEQSTKTEDDQIKKETARQYMLDQRINKDRINAVLELDIDDLRAIVAGRNIEKLMMIPNIGEKTAYKVVRALRTIFRPEPMRIGFSMEFTRVKLNHTFGSDEYYTIDTIRKGVSPVEAKAIELGGQDAIIHVVSKIPEAANLEEEAEICELLDWWHHVVHNRLVIGNKTYVPLGHGTNAAKECKTLWVLKEIHGKMVKAFKKGINPDWLITAAKEFAYVYGLQAVTRHSTGIPFMPEDVAIFPSVFSEIRGKMDKEFLDGHEEEIKDNVESVNRSDGYFLIDIPDCMIPEYINRLIVRGMDPEEAERKVMAFCHDHSINSYRVNGAAIKGCGDKHVNVHKWLHDQGITKLPDGRSVDTISLFIDETVLKTTIGPNGAYPTFEAWCDDVRAEFDLGVCVKAHGKSKKDVSYQVLQSLCEATDETIEKLVQPTIDKVNNAHTLEGASKLIGRERGHIMRIFPEFANERVIRETIERKLKQIIDEAFGGKLLGDSYYTSITPDPFYILQGWFGLEKTGCLEEGEAHVSGVKYGEIVFWRSPVVHPNSVRIYNNVGIKPEYRKYLKSEQFVIMMNSKDDVSMAAAADWDGDHGSVSEDENLVQAAKETLAIWNKLVVWETPKTKKEIITREKELDYIEGLTKTNELGLTVYGLNALLNRIIRLKDPVTKEVYTEVIPIDHRGVNFKVFAANVLVDASKHGGAEIDEPEESAKCKHMLQPWAKKYRDAVESKHNWAVTLRKLGETMFFETESEAQAFAKNYKDATAPVNYLDQLAKYNSLNPRHMAGTLNKVFALYAKSIDRSMTIHGLSNETFDFHKLMFNEEESRRGLIGLMREGSQPIVKVGNMSIRPDEGLFNMLARRYSYDRNAWLNDNTRKDEEDTSFEEAWRVSALAEIQAFAESMGKTLEDAHDVITWQMFKYIDAQYAKMDGGMDWYRDNLWRAYWLIFGGMAEEAAMRFETEED